MSRSTETIIETASIDPPALLHARWLESFPWLVQGTTTRGAGDEPFDLGLFSGGSPVDAVRARWSKLRTLVGSDEVVHARQVHGPVVRVHRVGEHRADSDVRERADPILAPDCDGHATAEPGILLTVSTADCVPVFVVDGAHRAVGVFHAGWRGAASGILESGLAVMTEAFGTRPTHVHVHLGPAICDSCYEVGPEVFEALGEPVPEAPRPVDLRGALARRALGAGVAAERVTISAHCTRCTHSSLFSHRAGDAHRQVGFIGVKKE